MSDTAHTREWARAVLRSGLLSSEQLYDDVRAAIATDHPSLDAEELTEQWLQADYSVWEAEALSWPSITDHVRLQAALAELGAKGLLVLQGCDDHWSARDALRAHPSATGVVWFTPADVWHAIDEPMLELNVWHSSTANVAPGEELLALVIDVLAGHGLRASFDEGRVEVAMLWQARPSGLSLPTTRSATLE